MNLVVLLLIVVSLVLALLTARVLLVSRRVGGARGVTRTGDRVDVSMNVSGVGKTEEELAWLITSKVKGELTKLSEPTPEKGTAHLTLVVPEEIDQDSFLAWLVRVAGPLMMDGAFDSPRSTSHSSTSPVEAPASEVPAEQEEDPVLPPRTPPQGSAPQ